MTAAAGCGSAPPGGWRRLVRRAGPGTVRARVTVVAGLALTAAVVLGLVVMYWLQLNSADQTIHGQLGTYAVQIEQSAVRGQPLPPSSDLGQTAQAQVLAPDGTVLAATRNWAGRPALYLYTLPPGSTTPVRTSAGDRMLPDDLSEYGEHATVGGRPVTIITTARTYLQSQIKQTFAWLLAIGVPVLLVLACGTVWLVTGRALRPVEQIRAAVTAVTSADLSQRVPEPGTDDEIGRLARTMNDMLARLEDSAAWQRRFVADASHELRSPLTAIRAGLEVGLAHPDRAPWPQIAGRAVRQSQRLEQLIAELLVLAKADAYQLAARRQPVDLAALLADLLAAATPAPGIRIDLSVPPGTATTGNSSGHSLLTQFRGRHQHPDAARPVPPRLRPVPQALRPPRPRGRRPPRRPVRPRSPAAMASPSAPGQPVSEFPDENLCRACVRALGDQSVRAFGHPQPGDDQP